MVPAGLELQFEHRTGWGMSRKRRRVRRRPQHVALIASRKTREPISYSPHYASVPSLNITNPAYLNI